MGARTEKTGKCRICGRDRRMREMMPAAMIRSSVLDLIRRDNPGFGGDDYICLDDLNKYRTEYIESMIEEDKGEISRLESDVVRSMAENELLAKNINSEYETQLTYGERLADRIASFGGSWPFILIFFCFFMGWMTVNSLALFWRPFDPFPYILLNLILSCLAAVQAPIIMMSQNRQEAKDRIRAEQDYRINLQAELEIRHLNEKIDHLVMHQWQRLLEIQKVQMEIMEAVGSAK